jgi:glycosyltransferase involved in cell wall biosynthesis
MRWFGFPDSKVVEGLNGADPGLFFGGPPLNLRPKTFLFVGQLIPRKDVLTLARVFLQFNAAQPGWTLRICGSGELRALIPSHDAIIVEDFVQPEDLVARYHQSRFLVLPSLVEAWGLVVHEAALCGCGLILSDAIGSIDDLSNSKNCISFKAGNEDDLYRALVAASKFDEIRLVEAEAASRELSLRFGPERFARAANGLVKKFTGEKSQISRVDAD